VKNDSIKKYLIPNIPYLFILWAFLKLGTAYRLAAGADFAHKLMGLGQTIGPAFADFSPGLAPFDWLVCIVGAVAFRVMVYVKSKNAKKFRRVAEYGSALWGCPKDITPFVDPKFENNIILTGTEFLTMNTRPKIRPTPATSMPVWSVRPAPAKPDSGLPSRFCRPAQTK
jgi:type IV secretion system protein VirD4